MSAACDAARGSSLHRQQADATSFITANLRLEAAAGIPDILLYRAHPGSRLSQMEVGDAEELPPYWAYNWAGGTLLARHILENPSIVQGRRVLDLGAGSGIVAIAAAKCGAGEVTAVDIDPNAIAAIGLNAGANRVVITAIQADLLSGRPPDVDIVLAGDIFYDDALAARVLPFLVACHAAGVEVLIGDPRRSALPAERLRLIAEYAVPDFGQGIDANALSGGVFTIDPQGDVPA